MKLTEIKDNTLHCFFDSTGQPQGKCKAWYSNGKMHLHCHYKDGAYHGEYKWWNSDGELSDHTFDINGKEVIDFLQEPDEYPSTPEDRLLFKLKYGTAPFLNEL